MKPVLKRATGRTGPAAEPGRPGWSRRLGVLAAVSLALFLALAGRLYAVAVVGHTDFLAQAEHRRRRPTLSPACRRQILDRLGRPLARDLPEDDVVCDLPDLDPALGLVRGLASALGVSREAALARLRAARAEAAAMGDDAEQLVLGEVPPERAEMVRRALKGVAGLRPGYERERVVVLADAALLATGPRTVERLAPLLGRDPSELLLELDLAAAAIVAVADPEERVKRWRRPMAVAAAASFDVVAQVRETASDLPGVRVVRRWRRVHPRGAAAAHLVGTIGAQTPEEAQRDDDAGRVLDASPDALGLLLGERTTLPDDVRLRDDAYGRTGIERTHDELLRGRPGATVLARDARGRTRATLLEVPAKDGQDVRLTIDIELQAAVEAALDAAVLRHGDGLSGGAAVLLDLRDGGVLVSASSPRYDPDSLGRDFDGLLADPRKPLLNRAVLAVPPASTFKALSAFALSAPGGPGSGKPGLPPGWTTECRGALFPGKPGFKCDGVHGTVDLPKALERSCNVFFFRAADAVGLDALQPWAEAIGLGHPVAGLPGERAGHVPTTASKPGRLAEAAASLSARTDELARTSFMDLAGQDLARRRAARAAWWLSACASDATPRPGDGRNAFIGQGDVLLTPVQVAWLAATIAGRGRAARPRVDAARPVEWLQLPYDPAVLNRVREGLRRVVTSGTASSEAIGLRGKDVAGKTGTAERGKEDPHLAWFMGYYPASAPTLALAILVDRTPGHGGDVCGPVARAAIEAYDQAILGKKPPNKPQVLGGSQPKKGE